MYVCTCSVHVCLCVDNNMHIEYTVGEATVGSYTHYKYVSTQTVIVSIDYKFQNFE